MSLFIVAAKDVDQAFEILWAKPRNAVKARLVEEPEEIGKFLYDLRAVFTNYEYYYRFDPYGDTYLETDQIPAIKVFSASVATWLWTHGTEENNVIQQYGVSFKEIGSFAMKLGRVCDTAMEHGYGLIGIGD